MRLLLVASLLLVAACATTPLPSEPADGTAVPDASPAELLEPTPAGTCDVTAAGDLLDPEAPDPSTVWLLEAGCLDGEELTVFADYPTTLSFQEQTLGGRAACNQYGGDYHLDGMDLDISDEIASTAMSCGPERDAAERAYVEALWRVTAVHRDGDRLLLSGPGVLLRFVRARAEWGGVSIGDPGTG